VVSVVSGVKPVVVVVVVVVTADAAAFLELAQVVTTWASKWGTPGFIIRPVVIFVICVCR
jgi:hypothetical protein